MEEKILLPLIGLILPLACLSQAGTLIYTSICHYCCVPVLASDRHTAMMTDADVNQSSGFGQAHSNNDRCWCKSKFWLRTGTQQ
jgi:hypothetical protein